MANNVGDHTPLLAYRHHCVGCNLPTYQITSPAALGAPMAAPIRHTTVVITIGIQVAVHGCPRQAGTPIPISPLHKGFIYEGSRMAILHDWRGRCDRGEGSYDRPPSC